jgi:hypothetical protein
MYPSRVGTRRRERLEDEGGESKAFAINFDLTRAAFLTPAAVLQNTTCDLTAACDSWVDPLLNSKFEVR